MIDLGDYAQADESWYPYVLSVLRRDYPHIFSDVWGKATAIRVTHEPIEQLTLTQVIGDIAHEPTQKTPGRG